MGKKTPAPPPAPDPVATTQAQGQANIETARANANMNRVDQYTPQGTLTYRPAGMEAADAAVRQRQAEDPTFDPNSVEGQGWRESVLRNNGGGPDRWQATTTYSPEQQQLYDLSTTGQRLYGEAGVNMLRGVQDTMSRPFQFNGPEMTGGVQDRTGGLQYGVQDRTGQLRYSPDYTGIGDANQSRDAVERALLERMNPSLTQNRLGAETRLRNQGLVPGSEAWNNAIRDVNQAENDARYGAILNAGQEQSRMFGLGLQQAGFNNDTVNQAYGMDMGRAGFNNQAIQQATNMDLARGTFGNAARQQSLQEQIALRAQPLNEAAALLTGNMIQPPQFQAVPGTQVANTDYLGAVGQQQAGQMAAYNSQVQNANAQRTGMYGLGAAAIGAAGTAGAAYLGGAVVI